MIRAFVGIALPEGTERALEALQAGLPAGRAVPPENFHITLAFLDSQPAPVLEDMHYALDRMRVPPVEIALRGLDLWARERETVLVADVAPSGALSHLRAKVQTAAREAGIALKARRFHPHVTLARSTRRLGAEDRIRLEAYAARHQRAVAAPFVAEAFQLFRSHLGSAGAHYEVLSDYPLTAAWV